MYHRSLASIRVSTGANRRWRMSFHCRVKSATRACSGTGFTACPTNTLRRCCLHVAPEIAGGRVIVAHLGSGASLCAMKGGKSIDNSLGFTALDGLCMGTRPGSLDPGVVLYLFQTLGMDAKQVETILYKKSGLLGISGISPDMRDLAGERRAIRAPGGGLFRVSRHEGNRRTGRGIGRDRRPRVHRRHRGKLSGNPAAHLRIVGMAGH